MDRDEVERLVRDAERRARASGIDGKALTPFLLQAIADASEGATLHTNRALLIDNARAAAEVARNLAIQSRESPDRSNIGDRAH